MQGTVQSQVPEALPCSNPDDDISFDKSHQSLAVLNPRHTVALLLQNPDRELEDLEIAAEFVRWDYHRNRELIHVWCRSQPVSRQRVFGSRQENFRRLLDRWLTWRVFCEPLRARGPVSDGNFRRVRFAVACRTELQLLIPAEGGGFSGFFLAVRILYTPDRIVLSE